MQCGISKWKCKGKEQNIKRKCDEMEDWFLWVCFFFNVNSSALQSAGLLNFSLLQAELTTVGMLLEMRKKEKSRDNREKN